jgi:DNA repair photolyase
MHEAVAARDLYRSRVERLVRSLQAPVTPEVFSDKDLPALLEGGLAAGRRAMGTMEAVPDPILLFNTFRFDGKPEDRLAQFSEAERKRWGGTLQELLGDRAFQWANYNQEGDPARHDKVCRPCWRIHLQNGCVHKCVYCGFGGLLISAVNIEEYCHWLGKLAERHPWQQTFLLDDDGDPPGLEPELGVLGPLIEFFGTIEGRYLIIHTKTWNTEWLRDLRHNGHTILVWSLSGATQSRTLEPVTGTTEQRIEAARVAQEAGYTIRYKFKPIIPVRGWEADASAAVELAFARTRPDVVSLCCFMWMDVDELKRRLPVDRLDPEFLAAAEAGKASVADTVTKPFPPEFRRRIYEHYLREIRRRDAKVPVSLSTESFALWKELEPLLGYNARNYPCGCGPFTVPGAPTLACDPFVVPVRNDGGEIPCVQPPWPNAGGHK